MQTLKASSSEGYPPLTIMEMIFQKENRISSKGIGLVFCYIELFVFIIVTPSLMKQVWPSFLEFIDSNGISHNVVYMVGLLAWH